MKSPFGQTDPLVSCLMPTRNRRPFVRQAISYFLRQDYPHRELVIVDDGTDPIADLVPEDPRIRYLCCERSPSLGAKRNLACEAARGEILVHWDDDDWHAPWRLSYQVGALLEHGVELCGLDRLWFYDPPAGRGWRYVYPTGSRPWVYGGTLCYIRSFWQRHPFAGITVGEDNRFVEAAAAEQVRVLENGNFYIGLVHAGNTSRKRPSGRRWRPAETAQLHELLGDDQAFYAHQVAGRSPSNRKPLVSCVMVTANRRPFVPDAIRYFLRQDYPERELIILDDGSDPIGDLVPEDPRIRYLRLEGRHSLGAKRNQGCKVARGEIIAFWDDDDWYAPHRLSYQVAPLLGDQAQLTVLGETPIYLHRTGEFWALTPELHGRMFYSGMVGGTQVFWKKLWCEGVRYPNKSLAEEITFIKKLEQKGASIEKLGNEDLFIYVRHGANSWKFTTGSFLDQRGWRRIERPLFLPVGDLEHRPLSLETTARKSLSIPNEGTKPRVSCIMATGDRRGFLRQAIKYFERQTYESKELVLIDDGKHSSADLVPEVDHIRYIRLETTTNLGKKLNLGIESSTGEILQKLDDDDYYHPEFLATTVAALLPHEPSSAIVGLDCFLVLLADTGELKFSGRGYCAGASLCFFRGLWEEIPFREVERSVDSFFLQDHDVRRVKVTNPELLIVVRHRNGHLWRTMGKVGVTDYFRGCSSYSKPLRKCIPTEDLPFYESLKRKTHGKIRGTRRVGHEANRPVSVCLLSWKRPHNIQRIVDSLHDYDFVDEILVWNNNSEVSLELSGGKVRVIDSPENRMCYGRFLCAEQAKNSVIYVQDDDVVVRNVPELYDKFDSNGDCIAHGLSRSHFRNRERYQYEGATVALLGWGAFFLKEWLHVLGVCVHDGAEDFVFRREADKFFTILLGQRHEALPARIDRLPSERTPGIALYREEQHERIKALAVRRALGLLRESRGIRFPVTWNIVVNCSDQGPDLQAAVESVLVNDADYRMTIVDDTSVGAVEMVGRTLAREHSHISYLKVEPSDGVGRARNLGVAVTDSVYVVFLDAQDRVGPDYLHEAERLLRSGCDVANPDAILSGDPRGRWRAPEITSVEMLSKRNSIHYCAAFRRTHWAEVRGYDEAQGTWSDYEFWIRLARVGARIRRLPGDHFFYRQQDRWRRTTSEGAMERFQVKKISGHLLSPRGERA